MTTNPTLYGVVHKKTFSDHLFLEEALSEEYLVKKIGKKKEEVIRKIVSSDTEKASPGRTDTKVPICLQTQTSFRLKIGMDDSVAVVTAAVAAY